MLRNTICENGNFGDYYENDYYNTAHTISSSYKWNGRLLDGLGIIRAGDRAGQKNRRKVKDGIGRKKIRNVFF